METSGPDTKPRTSSEFVDHSILEAVVPDTTSVDIEQLLSEWDGELERDRSSLLPFVPQRQFLLFDELVSVYVVLRTPYSDENNLKSYLLRLAISLEAHAVGTQTVPHEATGEAPRGPPPQAKEVLYSETIKESEEPLVIARGSQSSEEERGIPQHIFALWKLDVFLSHPRTKIQRPSLYFVCSASLRPAEHISPSIIEEEYLPSFVWQAPNLLQSFSSDPSLDGVQPRLSALRIQKVAPTAHVAKDLSRPLRTESRRLYRFAPAFLWRIRYSRPHASLSDEAVVTSLDFDFTTFAGCDIELEDIGVEIEGGGRIEPLLPFDKSAFGRTYHSGDQTTFLYKLRPESGVSEETKPKQHHQQSGPSHMLDLKIHATAIVNKTCKPRVRISWRTGTDMSGIYPSTQQAAVSRLQAILSANKQLPKPDSLPPPSTAGSQQDSSTTTSTSPDLGVSITISGPDSVRVGEVFRWDLFFLNRSGRDRKLAVVAVPKRRRHGHESSRKPHDSKHSLSSAGGPAGGKQDGAEVMDVAGAVVDDNVLYVMQKSAMLEPAEVICLSADVRVGPLSPSSCYSTDMKFLPLSTGVLKIDALRIVDLGSPGASFRPPATEAHSQRAHPVPCASRRTLPHSLTSTSLHEVSSTLAVLWNSRPPAPTMIENQRRRLLRALNSRYIYGRIPLLHCLIFLIQMAVVSILTRRFNNYYASRPVLTTMITNAVLGGIADTVAQSLTAIRQRAMRKPGGVTRDDFIAIEIHELDKKNPYPAGEIIPENRRLPPPFDFERLTRFMAYGFIMAPLQHKWFGFLSRTFPVTKEAGTIPALKRVAFDQFLFAPIGLAFFFTFMTVAEGGGKRAVTRKFQDVYVPALKANYMVWPAVQILNFRVIPLQFQIPFVSTVGIFWTAYLSLTNSSEES
ncbi:TRAPP trafficking subunit Trs65-domain-containing protein [Lineolata rhizophorae]|uniref:TRAPP trafficking subunit Trs65-domain-containing protein n=1 Tax=Lineolata rhizophorae TaxID=578093 RepID=A0A6A6PAH4_9PEZI|nr:TRAPP trafficking subunit Trs65-domain-containing protein [Lineolata rhizophorae]